MSDLYSFKFFLSWSDVLVFIVGSLVFGDSLVLMFSILHLNSYWGGVWCSSFWGLVFCFVFFGGIVSIICDVLFGGVSLVSSMSLVLVLHVSRLCDVFECCDVIVCVHFVCKIFVLCFVSSSSGIEDLMGYRWRWCFD